MSKHTPGPWKAAPAHSGIFDVLDANGRDIVTVFGGGVGSQFIEANARLIAAAPELLAVVKELLRVYSEPDERLCCDGRDCGCMGSTFRQQAEHYAQQAIDKAEGRI